MHRKNGVGEFEAAVFESPYCHAGTQRQNRELIFEARLLVS